MFGVVHNTSHASSTNILQCNVMEL